MQGGEAAVAAGCAGTGLLRGVGGFLAVAALMEIFMGKIKERETQSTSENSQTGILLELLLRTHHQV